MYYVPNTQNNILSLGQLLEMRYVINMADRGLLIRDKRGRLIAKVQMMKNHMFVLNVQGGDVKCLIACVKNTFCLWHLRFGHLNFGSLKLLTKKSMVRGLPFINHPEQLCEVCLLGKHHRSNFPKEVTSRASKPLQLVHKDVCGPISPNSLLRTQVFLNLYS